ncbi:hypothetical protein [Acidiphilium sp.]|uniref:hypothetical protein n=1 Tax=Acidiphilium sp. TaxID=527 RepID=UPI003D08A5A7
MSIRKSTAPRHTGRPGDPGAVTTPDLDDGPVGPEATPGGVRHPDTDPAGTPVAITRPHGAGEITIPAAGVPMRGMTPGWCGVAPPIIAPPGDPRVTLVQITADAPTPVAAGANRAMPLPACSCDKMPPQPSRQAIWRRAGPDPTQAIPPIARSHNATARRGTTRAAPRAVASPGVVRYAA